MATRNLRDGTLSTRNILSASFATFEPYKSHALHREVAVKWLAYLIAIGRPNSDLKRYIQADCHSAKKTPISIRYRPGAIYIYR